MSSYKAIGKCRISESTHLVSVPVAAATAVRGTLSSPADLEEL